MRAVNLDRLNFYPPSELILWTLPLESVQFQSRQQPHNKFLETVTPEVVVSPQTSQGCFTSYLFNFALPTAQGSNFKVMVYSCSRLRTGAAPLTLRHPCSCRGRVSRQPAITISCLTSPPARRVSNRTYPEKGRNSIFLSSRYNCEVPPTSSWNRPLDSCLHFTFWLEHRLDILTLRSDPVLVSFVSQECYSLCWDQIDSMIWDFALKK